MNVKAPRNPTDVEDLSFAVLALGSIPVIATKMAILRAINAALRCNYGGVLMEGEMAGAAAVASFSKRVQ